MDRIAKRNLSLFLSVSLAVFVCSYLIVRSAFPYPPEIDLFVVRWFETHRIPTITKIVSFVTDIGNLRYGFLFSVILSMYFLGKKRFKKGVFIFVSVNGAVAIHALVKQLVQRPRPDLHLIALHSYSFPSGHATLSAAIASSLFLLFFSKVQNRHRYIFAAVLFVWPITISLTRLYLSVHYFCDVVAGMVLGAAWTTLLFLLLEPTVDASSKQPNDRKSNYNPK